jgi:NUMOD4 motif/HNH endonuclease
MTPAIVKLSDILVTVTESAEQWRPVPGYEGFYEVSDMGNVRSAKRRRGSKGGQLKPALSGGRSPRLHVVLFHGSFASRKSRLVHQLVLEAFIGPRPPGMEACHGPGGPLDNRLVNLYWATHIQNMADRVRDGTAWGERYHMTKLTQADVAACRTRYAAGESQASLAREFGVSQAAISEAVTGRTWFWLAAGPISPRPPHRQRGDAHHMAKLTREIVAECKRRNAAGESQRALAREFGVTQATMWKAITGSTWA